MGYADYQQLAFERRAGGVLLITLNNPAAESADTVW